jgi:hypothetical protein
MKKVSEVKGLIDALGCDAMQRGNITDLLVACGVLEQDTEAKFKVGDVWEGQQYMKKVINITENHIECLLVSKKSKETKTVRFKRYEWNDTIYFEKLIWREP